MDCRRVVVLIDAGAPIAPIDDELSRWRLWLKEVGRADVSVGIVVFAERAGWVPETSGKLATSASLRAVGVAQRPALNEALDRVASAGREHAVATLLAHEPSPGWEAAARALGAPFRACVAFGSEPVAAVGQGRLGAAFRAEHLGLALRWLVCELCDGTWRCACGSVRVRVKASATCDSCGAPSPMPPRLRVRGRVVLLAPGALLFPHHVGEALAFDRPVARLDELVPRAGELSIGGVSAEVRTGEPTARARTRRFEPPPIRARVDACHACGGELMEPIGHAPPDPRRFCASCVRAPFRCDFCGVPLGPKGGNVWPDGRSACAECWSTSVSDLDALAGLEVMARRWMRRRLGMEMPPCPLHLEHAAAIARMHGRTFEPCAGRTPRPVGFFRWPVHQDGAAIFIEHGTPKSFAYGVLVHELTHLWQWHNWPRERPPTLIEGLAMWAEYHALLDAAAIHAARHAELYGDPVYGLGFRVALAVEKQVGFDRVKETLHAVERAPG